MKRFAFVALALLALSALLSIPASAQQSASIRGQVVNGTPSGGSVAGIEVILRTFPNTGEVTERSTTADEQGRFLFTDLQPTAQDAYQVRVSYQGVVYSSGLLTFEQGQTELAVDVIVYETFNPDDRTYVGTQEMEGRQPVSRFQLPRSAHDLTFEDGTLGGRFLTTEDGFADTEPLWPGSTSVLFSYVVDCPGGICDLSREIVYPIANLNVLLADAGSRIESERLVLEGRRGAEGTSYLNYVGHDLSAGETLQLRIVSSRAAPSSAAAPTGRGPALPWIILGAVLAAQAIAYPFWRERVRAKALANARESEKR